jgi:large subunit ribosomal protein L23
MSQFLSIIKKPLITERAANLKAQHNQYVFKVNANASKGDIKRAIEELFKVGVTRVRTMKVHGKWRRMGNSAGAYRPDWKKAIVSIEAGKEIKFAEETE